MRIGILTVHFANNYGAVFQAYALKAYLASQGHDVVFVDYQPPYMVQGGRFRCPRSLRDIHGNASAALAKVARIRESIWGKTQRDAFNAFRSRHFPLTERYLNIDQLRCSPPDVDALICGSDQIWNPPSRFGVDPAYYLAFGPGDITRLSYAPSFGKATLDAVYRPQVSALLMGLNAISVREKSGVDIVRSLTGRNAFWAPDPTLLLQEYRDFPPLSDEPPRCFVYCLRGADHIPQVVKAVTSRFNLEPVCPYNPMQHFVVPGPKRQMGPADWLGTLRNAGFVITNSYHATLFSVLMNRPFLCVGLGGRNEPLMERMRSFLGRLGLLDRFLPRGLCEQDHGVLTEDIDWSSVNALIAEWREEGACFLRRELACP